MTDERTNQELHDVATDVEEHLPTRIEAQDELSRRAHYNQDTEALSLLMGESFVQRFIKDAS